jgi:hypothetical protein
MAITANTPTRMILDAGDLYINAVGVGATKPTGNSFAVEQEIYFPELAGAKGGLAGTGKVIKETATLTFSVPEISMANLLNAIPTLASSSDSTSEYTTLPDVGYVGTTPHITVEWKGTNTNSKAVHIILYNAIAEGGLTLNLDDTGETIYQATFRSYYTSTNPKQRTWKVSFQL